uniref:PNK FHA domain-containing protein n=1 Tax=Anopheles atroparvus TaxID=41427 RepID=A0AAG5DNA5_ANOAO
MSKTPKEFLLAPVSGAHPPIRIKAEQTMVGRSPETLIQDANCSRNQVCLKANLEERYVLVKTLGLNPSLLNGVEMERNKGYEAKAGDVIELLPGLHRYTIDLRYETSSGSEAKPPVEVRKESIDTRRTREQKTKEMSGTKRSRHEASPKDDINGSFSAKRAKSTADLAPTVSSDAKPRVSLTPTTQGVWEAVDGKLLHLYTSAGVVASDKIAAYDMDGTLIKTKSGNVFPKSIDDWQIAFPEVPGKLKALHKNGFKLVIFTNQAGIGKGKVRIEDFRQKIEALVRKLSVPIQVFISTGSGKYRKPRTGMWETLCESKNDGVPVDKVRSFYVGDAAGRPEMKKPIKRKKDHSSADRLLALNVGIPFLTPEMHFQNVPDTNWVKPEFDPKDFCDGQGKQPLLAPAGAKLTSGEQEVIIMIGFPGSGKSHFVRQYLAPKGYEIVNRDTLGSWQKCVTSMESAIQRGKSVVIDNMNPDVESRKRYLQAATRANIPVRCFVMDVSYKHARHNNAFRELTDRSHSTIPDMVFNSYKSKFQEPTVKEGYKEIVKVQFVPKFTSPTDEQLYRMFLLEK